MTTNTSAAELFDRLKRKAPEYLDLITATTDAQFEEAFTALLEKATIGHLEKIRSISLHSTRRDFQEC